MATCHHLSGATWRKHCSPTVGQPPPDHRSTVVNDGSQRWSTTVNAAGPPVNDGQRWRTTVDHRRTTGQRWSTAGQGGSTVGSWAGQYQPPKRTSAATKTTRAAAPMTAAAVEQLVADRVSATLANHDTLRNSTNGYGDGSHNSGTGTRRAMRTPHECTYKDFLNCHPLNFKGTEGECPYLVNSHKKAVMQEVAYAMDWKALKKLMTVKYCPRGKIKKLEIKLWNIKVKGTHILSYTLRFQELALMCGRIFPEESDEVKKYVSGLPDMIRGNVMSYRPQTMEEKRKIEFNAGNNQGYQQQNRRQNTRRTYTTGSGKKREYTRIFGLNNNNNNRGNSRATQNAVTCYEYGVQGHIKRDCPKNEIGRINIKSSVEDLVHTLSESDGISEGECDLPVYDDFSSLKKDEVLDDIISIPPGNGNDHFNAESSLIESVLNRDNVISSPKIDFLIEEFAGELALIAPILSGIVKADLDPKEDIHFSENLIYDNSFPRPPETLKDDYETVIDSNNDYFLSVFTT
ncbi:putative reverse transcriptase domain-containing protein [Tanacetum coccineum]